MKKLIFFIGFILAVSLTVFWVRSRVNNLPSIPSTRLSFSPDSVTVTPDESFSLNIHLDTGENSISAAKLVITFDPNKLEAIRIINGPFAPKISASGIVSPGIASITVAAEDTTLPIKGNGVIASIQFRAKETTIHPVSIQFDPATIAMDFSDAQSNDLTTSGITLVSIHTR